MSSVNINAIVQALKLNKKNIFDCTEKKKHIIHRRQIVFQQLEEDECKYLSGLKKENIRQISDMINRNQQLVFEFFYILHHNLSQRHAGYHFGKTQSTISLNFERMVDSLRNKFISKYLHQSRESIVKNHIPAICKNLFPNVKGIIDGTYLYYQQSTNFEVQKKTYSMHKHRNLWKMMGIVLPDGRFWDIIGPFYADGDHNDQWIWNYILLYNIGNLKNHFRVGEDEFIADRGFQRALKHFKLWCPGSLRPRNKQLSWLETNNTRLVTKIRNVIERAFGRLKMWKFLSNTIDASYVRYMTDIYQEFLLLLRIVSFHL